MLLRGSDLDEPNKITHGQVDTEGAWIEFRASLTGFQRTAVMAFGVQADTAAKRAWFDYFRIMGTGPDRSKLLCSQSSCPNGTYVSGAATGICKRAIGLTSFEEPPMASDSVKPYVDLLGGDNDHKLVNYALQNVVEFSACARGSGSELGFRTYYTNTMDQPATGGLADGDVIGVIGDVTTPQRGDYGQGGKAPHGSQYYAMEDTGGFVYVEMDPVDVSDYSDVVATAWVHIDADRWDTDDLLKIWVMDGSSQDETILIKATKLDSDPYIKVNTWMEFSTQLYGLKTTAVMAFGLQSDKGTEEAWFDYMQILGSGPDRVGLLCARDGLGSCPNGTQRTYVCGAAADTAVCEPCAKGKADSDSNTVTKCTDCPAGLYSDQIGSLQCKKCPGYPERGVSHVASTTANACEYTIGYSSFEETTIVNVSAANVKCSGGCEPICAEDSVFSTALGAKNGVRARTPEFVAAKLDQPSCGVQLNTFRGMPTRSYEFAVAKLSTSSGEYSKLMKAKCADMNMKPVCDHPYYCRNDNGALYIGQQSHVAYGYYRNHNYYLSRFFPGGFVQVRDLWNGLCSYTGRARGNYAFCNIPSNSHQWRHPGQINPGFVCGTVIDKVELGAKNGVKQATYEFAVGKLHGASGSYSALMISNCKKFMGMKPVCDNPDYCKNDQNSLYLGQTGSLSLPSVRGNRNSVPANFYKVSKTWNGKCSYTGAKNGNSALCNIPSSKISWKRPSQSNPGFLCGRVAS
eukprot:COSAG05_NODE_1907_length_3849_cov_4.846133_2_plen_742_part_01